MNELDDVLRLLVAAGTGLLIGIDRDMNNKPVGMRTLALVALGSALVSISVIEFQNLRDHPDAISRVIQGVVAGVLTGVGFIGAGVILRRGNTVRGLSTAATFWAVAAVGTAAGLAEFGLALGLTMVVLLAHVLLRPVSAWIERRAPPSEAGPK